MSSVDFDKIWFKKLEETDDLSGFNCDEDDDGGCDEFIHKPEEAKQYQKERHGVTYLFYFGETMVGYKGVRQKAHDFNRGMNAVNKFISINSVVVKYEISTRQN